MDFKLSEEQLAFRDAVIRFCREKIEPFAEEADLKAEFPFEAWRRMGEFGLLGLHYPAKFGGQEADVLTSVIAGEAMGYGGADGGLLLAWGAHTYLCGDTILSHGNEEQKAKYLPKIASGEWIGCMGLTEPGAGSDAASIRTTAVKTDAGWLLNGTKMFITNGPIADVAVVYAVTDKSAGHGGVSGFIVEKGTPGFSSGKPMHKLGVRSSQTSELIFDNCEIPAENLLGVQGMGFLMALQTLEWDRSALLSPYIGSARRWLETCAKYSEERVQFGKPISEFQAIQHKLADLRIYYNASRLLVYRVAWNKDQGRPLNHLEASIAKLYMGDQGMQMASEAVQIHGGYGFIHEYPVERGFRDSKLGQIGGGTSEVQHMIISRMLSEEAR
jgi:butyryl-CoA dehydrogenase